MFLYTSIVGFDKAHMCVPIRDLSSAGRASALQAEGHRFEPCRSHLTKYGEIAQLARACGSYPQCRGFKSPSRYCNERGIRSDSSFYCSNEKITDPRHCGAVERAHDVRGTSVLHRPERSVDQIPLSLLHVMMRNLLFTRFRII